MKLSTRLTKFLMDVEITEDMNLPYQEHFMKEKSPFSNQTMFDYLLFLQSWLQVYFHEERIYSFTEYLDFTFFRDE